MDYWFNTCSNPFTQVYSLGTVGKVIGYCLPVTYSPRFTTNINVIYSFLAWSYLFSRLVYCHEDSSLCCTGTKVIYSGLLPVTFFSSDLFAGYLLWANTSNLFRFAYYQWRYVLGVMFFILGYMRCLVAMTATTQPVFSVEGLFDRQVPHFIHFSTGIKCWNWGF